jgi:hypothetical protein
MAELHQPHTTRSGNGATPPVETRREESDVNIGGILGFGAALIVAALVINLIVYVLFRYYDSREAQHVAPQFPLAVAQERRLPPEPRLQTDPRQDLADLRAKETETLGSYGWVDRNAGIVRIPIDEAIRLTLQRGLPSRQSQKP